MKQLLEKKIAVFSPNQIQGFKYNFGWPIYNQTKCNFFFNTQFKL